ncbi:MAG: PilZ domain-containing protein [Deltaproteobacteria bacterium]|nr:PilZ domain-containing protein [Deltaproteobacteria bacterium]
MEENRRDRRHYLMAEVLIRTSPAPADDPVRAVLMNINRGGIGVYSPQPLKKKTHVVVRIAYREGTKTIAAEDIQGSVCWSHAIGKSWAAGISFSERVTRKNYPILNKCFAKAKMNK